MSFTTAVPATSPVFVTVIVYVITSSFSTVSLFAVFVAFITGFFVVGVSLSFTFAVFMIEPSAPSFTVTLKLTVTFPPFASTSSTIPLFKSVSPNSGLASPLTLILPSTNVVPSGTSSFITASPAAVPLFVAVIVYSISSPTATAVLFDVFSALITGSWYVVSVSSVGSSFTFAWFLITVPSLKSPTFTSNVNVTSSFAGTSTSIPSFKFASV